MPLLQNKKKRKLFDTIDFQQEFNSILLFISEICEVPCVLITLIELTGLTVKAKIGLDLMSLSPNILAFNETIIQQNKIKIVSDFNNDVCNQSENLVHFFAGFPICLNENLVIGSICIINTKPKKLSSIQLKYLDYAVQQIQSLLQLHIENKELQERIKQQENQFQLFIDNAKEIVYEINLESVFSYVSNNWTKYLGYDIKEVLGKSIASFVHPEDLENSINFLDKVIKTGKNEGELIYRIRHKEGHYVWHETRLKLSQKKGSSFFIGNCRDITEDIEVKQKLLQQKDFYETILNNLPTDVVVFDSNHKYIYVNPVAIKNKELRTFIIGKDDFEYAQHMQRDPSFANSRRERFLAALHTKEVIVWEEILNTATDGKTYHNRKMTPVFNGDGSFKMMIGFSVNITESKKIQEEILQSRALVQNILSNTAVGILVQGPNSEILENNLAASEMLGLTQDQLLGKTSFDEFWHVINENGTNFEPEDHPVPQCIKLLKPINNIVMGVHRPTKKDLVWLLVDAIPIFNNNQELLYVICSFNNITHQKKTEEALKISNERFTYATKATSDVIWDWEIGSENFIIGENYTKLFGHKINNEHNFLKVTDFDNLIHPDDLERVLKNVKATLESKATTWYDEFRYLKSDGSYAYLLDTAYIIRDKSNKAIRMIGAQTDITTKKKVSEELRISEEKFKGAFEHSAVGMAIIDLDGFWIETNKRSWEILGYTREEFKKLTCAMMTYPDDIEADVINKKRLTLGLAPNFSVEKRHIHKNKSIVWVHLSVSVVRDNEGRLLYFIPQIIDITERKKIENENRLLAEENNRNKIVQLNEARNMYRLLADNTADLVCLHNLDTSFIYVSPSIQKLLDYTPEELLGKSPLDLAHPEDLPYLESSFNDFISKKVDDNTIARFKARNGNYIWLETKASLIEKEGEITGFQSSSRDITIRKKEEEAIDKALVKERELNELRTNLVSTISHEFRTPMTTIRTSAELISMYLENQNLQNGNRLQKRVEIITEEIDRIVELMNAVLTISKEDSGKTNFKPTLFDLKEFCLEIIDSYYLDKINLAKLKTNFNGSTFTVNADTKLMEYSIFNILNNAFKYSENYEEVILNLSSTSDTIILEIIDFGIGIPKEDQHKLFNTFFRASNTDGIQGTGLGLYIAKTFTEKNSGTITLESDLGKGTTVTLKFPLNK
ncbi:PAS domain S-box-containing protein [Flavobacterium omnivorum]|uniref:histidine kinase n=1 Tax=Flavobacterium omnivorum TaxID=178355 RepID=A0A1G8I9B9_9FLAO|nr:PAS domain S-box protein [Flavobacterium omnivorum]SDI15474.1 PAS domain S-box-containing protein [Flavobacterium omnivorum]